MQYPTTVLLFAALSSSTLAFAEPYADHFTYRVGSDPSDARIAVPPARYTSAFSPYRKLADVAVGSWREANDQVGRIGGWRAYAREAVQNEPSAPAGIPSRSPDRPAPSLGGHGHQTK